MPNAAGGEAPPPRTKASLVAWGNALLLFGGSADHNGEGPMPNPQYPVPTAQCPMPNALMHHASIHQSTNALMHHASIHQCTNAPMHQCTNAPMDQCTNAPMHQCTNAPGEAYNETRLYHGGRQAWETIALYRP